MLSYDFLSSKLARFLCIVCTSIFLVSCKSILVAATGNSAYYKVSENKVEFYLWNPMSERHNIREVVGADPVSFEQISPRYGRDKNSVFHHNYKIERADSDSFRLINEYYATDKNHAYFWGQLLEDSHSASYEMLGHSWSRDRNNYYYQNHKIDLCDWETFEIIELDLHSRAIDSKCYYYQSERVEGVDRESLQILISNYAKDKNRVYWANILIEEADPSTFEVDPEGYYTKFARDSKQCFSGPRLLSCDSISEARKDYCYCNQ